MSLRTLLLLFTLSLCTSVSAQSVPDKAKDRAANRAEQKANNKLDQKVDQAVDETFKAIEGLFKKKNKKNKKGQQTTTQTARPDGTTPQPGDADYEQTVENGGLVPNNGDEYADDEEVGNALSNLFGGGDFEPFTNEVTFSMDMEIKSTKRNGKTEETTMSIAMAPTQIAQKVELVDKGEKGSSWSIFDTQTGKVTIITSDKGKQTGMRMKAPNLKNLMKDMEPDMEAYMDGIEFSNTGETRVIEGYNTTKYIITNSEDNSVTESWVTTEIQLDQMALARAMTSFMGGSQTLTSAETPIEGFPIYTVQTDKKGVRTEMTYKNVKVGAAMEKSLFNTSGIDIQEIPGF